jgi:hypothetical protein
VLIRLGLDRHRLRHEPDLHVRLDAPLEIGVEDAIDNRPVVNRLPAGVLRVGVRRSPFERRRAIAGGQEIVRTEVDAFRRQLALIGDQLLAGRQVGVIGLVSSEETPDLFQRPGRLAGVDPDGNRKRRARRSLRRGAGSDEGSCRENDGTDPGGATP